VASLSGLATAALAAWLGTRLGRAIPIGLALMVSGSAQYTLVNASSETVYVTAYIAWNLAFDLWTPFVMGTLAALDRGGRWTVAGGAITMLGAATGPWVAGQLLERWPDRGLSVLVVSCAATALLLLTPVTIALDRAAGRFAAREAALAGKGIE